ncbi:DUF928 domain-containing protein [Pantanalinema sp. GBBB05]|uniref:DUF928 domain-containing protein n=1 Tax=Pantanalinema sp. GBBB05 TaxID=2604139 RepID=UPI001D578DD0|nr:DUF928 domain-containing protein [Pantanalinema sp. GBBB05]
MKRIACPPQSWIGAGLLLTTIVSSLVTPIAQAQFGSPPGQGTPKGTAGGGSRPATHLACLQKPNHQENLVALAPTQSVGLTTQATPTIWVYVPNTTATTLEFSLFTQAQEGLYQVNLPIRADGLLKITLPANTASLTPNQSYYWTAALVCDPKRRTKDWLVEGRIQQQPLSAQLQQQLAAASAEQQIQLYLQAGFWYDALNTYLELSKTQPNHPALSLLWTDLLKTAGLRPIAAPTRITQANP